MMKPIKVMNEQFKALLDEAGRFELGLREVICPEESGFHVIIESQKERIELARFLREVADTLEKN